MNEKEYVMNIKNELTEANVAFQNEMVINCQTQRTIKELEKDNYNIQKIIYECKKIGIHACYPEQIKERIIKGHKEPELIFFI